MIIRNKFNIGDLVTCKTDTQKRKMIVTEIYISKGGIAYLVSFFEDERTFWEFELEKYNTEDSTGQGGDFNLITTEYIKGLNYEVYISLLKENDIRILNEILHMLVEDEEYEIAEVTKRYIDRIKKK